MNSLHGRVHFLEIGHFHSCTVSRNEGKNWLGRLESKHSEGTGKWRATESRVEKEGCVLGLGDTAFK